MSEEIIDNTSSSFTFFVLSDFGNPTQELSSVASAMDYYAKNHQSPSMIFGLGDNFYPWGVESPDDKAFQVVWSDMFLQYDSLRVPWFMLLGNHDYMGNPTAQIEFTHHRKNLFNLWRMPSNYYKVSLSGDNLADFFALDTNGCQNHVKRSHPETINCLKHQISWLDSELKSSTSPWKFVLGHHPMYNKGRGHASVAKCLREEKYTKVVQSYYGDCEEVQCEGYGLEKVISQHERIIYLSGHEHVFQQHWANGVQHVVCGNSGAEVRDGMGFYGGINDDVNVDWYDDTNSYGFVAVEVSENVVSIDFVNSQAEAFQSIKVPC